MMRTSSCAFQPCKPWLKRALQGAYLRQQPVSLYLCALFARPLFNDYNTVGFTALLTPGENKAMLKPADA